MYTNVLIYGNSRILNLFNLLKHFHMNIFNQDNFNQKINFDLVITNPEHIDLFSNYHGLVFNVVTDNKNFNTKKNVVNLYLEFDPNQDSINQFIENKIWNFYYKSVEKHNVKFIYDLFSVCSEYHKIRYREVKFHKIE